MKCIICNSTDKWENVDQYRTIKSKKKYKDGGIVEEPIGMAICNGCGFISYPSLWATESEIKAYYKKDYRRPPNSQHYYQGRKKIIYHKEFLEEVLQGFEKRYEETKEAPVFCEIGCASGMFLYYLKKRLPYAEVNGTEWTLSYKRNCYHEHDIKLVDDFDPTKKYDMITSYKVLEHQLDADQHLRRYVESLKEGGYIYISVPTWFKALTNFGQESFDLEYYYSTNHVNVWTQKNFENLLKKCGLKIIKFNDTFYDETYLCQRDDSLMSEKLEYEDPKRIKECLDKAMKAYHAVLEGRLQEAVQIWANYPNIYISLYESQRAVLHKLGFDEIIKTFVEPAIKNTNGYYLMYCLAGDICSRYSHWSKAIEFFNLALEKRPNHLPAVMGIGHCFNGMAQECKDEKEKPALFARARESFNFVKNFSEEHADEARNWAYAFNAEIPYEGENA